MFRPNLSALTIPVFILLDCFNKIIWRQRILPVCDPCNLHCVPRCYPSFWGVGKTREHRIGGVIRQHFSWQGRINDKRTGKANNIRFAFLDRQLRLLSRLESAGDHKRDGRSRSGLFRKLNEVGARARTIRRRWRTRKICSATNVNQVDACVVESSHDLQGFVLLKPPLDLVSRVEFDPDGKFGTDSEAHLFYSCEQKPHPVFQAAPIGIFPLVEQRRKELA
mmetsp:Transcript_14661/g.22341  ORF Transcript_14661/g.22341 Transcript_14661/m.22341 type:complete len:222 (+) Transcript_14661:544-1209(+)